MAARPPHCGATAQLIARQATATPCLVNPRALPLPSLSLTPTSCFSFSFLSFLLFFSSSLLLESFNNPPPPSSFLLLFFPLFFSLLFLSPLFLSFPPTFSPPPFQHTLIYPPHPSPRGVSSGSLLIEPSPLTLVSSRLIEKKEFILGLSFLPNGPPVAGPSPQFYHLIVPPAQGMIRLQSELLSSSRLQNRCELTQGTIPHFPLLVLQ